MRRRIYLRGRIRSLDAHCFSGLNEAYTDFTFFSIVPCPYEFDHINQVVFLLLSLSSLRRLDFVTRHFARTEDDRYSQLARSTSGRQTERPERGNSVKRERCAAGRQRYGTDPSVALAGGTAMVWPVHLDDVRYHLVVEPYHPPGRHPSTLARSSATHPAGVITPLTPRPLDLPLSRCFSLLRPSPPALRLLPFPTSSFHVLSHGSSYSQRHDRVFFSRTFPTYTRSGSSYTCTVTISRYHRGSRKH